MCSFIRLISGFGQVECRIMLLREAPFVLGFLVNNKMTSIIEYSSNECYHGVVSVILARLF